MMSFPRVCWGGVCLRVFVWVREGVDPRIDVMTVDRGDRDRP